MLQRNDLARLFIFIGEEINRTSPCPVFINTVEIDPLTQNAGDLTLAFAPDPDKSGEFEEVAAFRTTKERSTSSLIVRLEIDDVSVLQGVHSDRCTFDAHFNVGTCFQVSGINQFTKKEIWEDASLTTLARSKGKTFDSSAIELVTETYGVSIKKRYTILNPLYYAQQAIPCAEFGNDATCIAVPPSRCCHTEPGAVAFIGSGADNGRIGYTTNFGRTWHTFDTGTTVNFKDAGVIRNTVVLVDNTGHAYRIDLRSEQFCNRTLFEAPVLDGFCSNGLVGIGISNTPDAGVLYVMRGSQSFVSTPVYRHTRTLLPVYDAKSGAGFVVIDADNRIVWSKDGSTWAKSTPYAWPVESTPHGIAIRGPGQWILSASDFLYATNDYGRTWRMGRALPYPGPIHSSNRHCLESAGWDATNNTVRVFRSTDANGSWYEEPNQVNATLLSTGLNPSRLVTAPENPNIIWVVGHNESGPPVILGRA